MSSKKPDIVVYLSDDHGWEYLGCYGNEHIRTPHLDSLAEEGIRFTHALPKLKVFRRATQKYGRAG